MAESPAAPPAPPTLGRVAYALAGLLLFGLKHNLDRVVASAFFGRSWSLFNYVVPPEHGASLLRLKPGEMRFYATLLLLAAPFILAGVILTLRRLRSAGLPLLLVVLFFVPVVNLVFFLVLCLVPARDATPSQVHARWLDRAVPESVLGSALAAVGLTLILGGLLVLLGVIFAVEGLLCVLMAGPLAGALALFGGMLGYVVQRRVAPPASPATLVAVALSAPLLMAAEHASPPTSPFWT